MWQADGQVVAQMQKLRVVKLRKSRALSSELNRRLLLWTYERDTMSASGADRTRGDKGCCDRVKEQ